MLFHGSFLPIPSKDLFKSNSFVKDTTQIITATSQRQSADEFVLVEHDQQKTPDDYLYPGKILAYESPKTETKPETGSSNVNTNNANEEGELKDDEEIVEVDADEKMQTSESSKLSDTIYLNRDKTSSDCVLLTVFNSSNQTIKVNSLYFDFKKILYL